MRHYLTFDDVNLSDLGVYISGSGVFNAPERLYETIEVPGRNGLLLGQELRLDNIEVTYPAFIYKRFPEAMTRLKGLLLSRHGYKRIQDTYYPSEYRLGYYAGPMEVEPAAWLEAGKFDLTFICKPQRYLVEGETERMYTRDSVINNPSDFASQPLLTIYGSGSVTIGGVMIEVDTDDPYIEIDCEAMDAYYQQQNRNAAITLSGNDFPTIPSGESEILVDGPSLVRVIPRWWVI